MFIREYPSGLRIVNFLLLQELNNGMHACKEEQRPPPAMNAIMSLNNLLTALFECINLFSMYSYNMNVCSMGLPDFEC